MDQSRLGLFFCQQNDHRPPPHCSYHNHKLPQFNAILIHYIQEIQHLSIPLPTPNLFSPSTLHPSFLPPPLSLLPSTSPPLNPLPLLIPLTPSLNSPCHHDEEVQSVPGLSQVALLSDETHGHDLDHHLGSEESEDEVIEPLEDQTSLRVALDVAAWTIHTQGDAVEDDHHHADPFKPSVDSELRKNTNF